MPSVSKRCISLFGYEVFSVIVFIPAPLDEFLQLLSFLFSLQVYVVLNSTGKADDELKDGSHLFLKRMETGNTECDAECYASNSSQCVDYV